MNMISVEFDVTEFNHIQCKFQLKSNSFDKSKSNLKERVEHKIELGDKQRIFKLKRSKNNLTTSKNKKQH